MPTEYLDKAGLEYFWSKLKLYIDQHSGGGGGGGIGDGVPVGMIMDFGGSVAPTGYLVCNGDAVPRSTYSALFAVIGTTWGEGDGSTTFNLPDLCGRSTVGIGTAPGGSYNRALGSTGGSETHNHIGGSHTLTTSEIPSHNHRASDSSAGYLFSTIKSISGQSGSLVLSSGTNRYAHASNSGWDDLHLFTTTQNTGGGGAHDHGYTSATSSMQPYATVNKIIKAIPDTPASGGIDLSTTTASLGTTGWSNNSKTVNVTGVTASNVVIISPAPADADAWADAGIICTAQGSGTLTFECDTVPSSSLTANILILEEDS